MFSSISPPKKPESAYCIALVGKTLESPLKFKEFKPVHPKGNQFCIFIGRIDADAEAETPILWLPDAKTDSLEEILMLGKTEGRRKRG